MHSNKCSSLRVCLNPADTVSKQDTRFLCYGICFTSYKELSICPTPPHRVDLSCCNRQSSGQCDPSGDRSSHFYQGSARTCPVLHSCTAATLRKRKKKLKFTSTSLLIWIVNVLKNELTQSTLPHSSVNKAKQKFQRSHQSG